MVSKYCWWTGINESVQYVLLWWTVRPPPAALTESKSDSWPEWRHTLTTACRSFSQPEIYLRWVRMELGETLCLLTLMREIIFFPCLTQANSAKDKLERLSEMWIVTTVTHISWIMRTWNVNCDYITHSSWIMRTLKCVITLSHSHSLITTVTAVKCDHSHNIDINVNILISSAMESIMLVIICAILVSSSEFQLLDFFDLQGILGQNRLQFMSGFTYGVNDNCFKSVTAITRAKMLPKIAITAVSDDIIAMTGAQEETLVRAVTSWDSQLSDWPNPQCLVVSNGNFYLYSGDSETLSMCPVFSLDTGHGDGVALCHVLHNIYIGQVTETLPQKE